MICKISSYCLILFHRKASLPDDFDFKSMFYSSSSSFTDGVLLPPNQHPLARLLRGHALVLSHDQALQAVRLLTEELPSLLAAADSSSPDSSVVAPPSSIRSRSSLEITVDSHLARSKSQLHARLASSGGGITRSGDLESLDSYWFLFDAASLRGLKDARTRFQFLFRIQLKWSLQEIECYVEDLLKPSQKLDTLLLKYARVLKDAKNPELVYYMKK